MATEIDMKIMMMMRTCLIVINHPELRGFKGESNSLSYTYGYTDIRKYGSIRFSKFEIVSPLLKPLLFAHDI